MTIFNILLAFLDIMDILSIFFKQTTFLTFNFFVYFVYDDYCTAGFSNTPFMSLTDAILGWVEPNGRWDICVSKLLQDPSYC